jgi:hypothetical protein
MVNQPFLVLLDYLADLQNLAAVMLVNHLVCRNKLLKNNAFTVKNDCQHPVDVSPDLLFFFYVQKTGISTLKALFFFVLGNDSKPRFCLWVQLPMYAAKLSAIVLFLHIHH